MGIRSAKERDLIFLNEREVGLSPAIQVSFEGKIEEEVKRARGDEAIDWSCERACKKVARPMGTYYYRLPILGQTAD